MREIGRLMSDVELRARRGRESLLGLAIGDGFGERFFEPAEQAGYVVAERVLPRPPWRWTDDTALACALLEHLEGHGHVDQDALARHFAAVYLDDPYRGYGSGMHQVLPRIAAGQDWRAVTAEQFGGQGSWGNGSAMRVAPLGAFFAGDLDRAVEQAARQAEVTHAHDEAVAGAVAVAVAAGVAAAGDRAVPQPDALLRQVLWRLEPSEVRDGVDRVAALPADTPVTEVVAAVGNGSRVSCPDTVPFALWVAAHHLDDYETALWLTATAGGDRDTTCAIVGGIIAARVGRAGLPPEWIERCEDLPGPDVG